MVGLTSQLVQKQVTHGDYTDVEGNTEVEIQAILHFVGYTNVE